MKLRNFILTNSFLIVCFSSCLGPKKIDKWVDSKYGDNINSVTRSANDYLSVTTTLNTAEQKVSSTVKETKNMLPLVFYWKYDYVNTCTLNPKIPVNTFKAAVQSYASSKQLKQKLGGQKLELIVNRIPTEFVLNDRGHIVWVIYAISWDYLTFRPDNSSLDVSYKLSRDNVETKKGVVTIRNTDKEVSVRYMQSIKRATGDYLDQYDENIKQMSKKVVDQIIAEL